MFCKDCRFWKLHNYGTRQIYVCEAVESSEPIDDNDFGISVYVDDESGLEVRLVTGPNFGCVRGSRKGV